MNAYYTNNSLKALDAKMAFIKGKGAQKASQAIAKVIEDGNTYDRLNGRDRYGRTIAPLRSKRTGKYKGATGKPLVPFGMVSRAIRSFKAKARQRAGKWQVVAGFINVVSAKGVAFLPFHDLGGRYLPRRPIFGISPRTWALIKPTTARFVQEVKAVR